uniref:(northern house mosquito) hypothetical protein n=1 Tax=Culex pipiens TaxID=7175 RepID=A0A8D8E1P3_CULPI
MVMLSVTQYFALVVRCQRRATLLVRIIQTATAKLQRPVGVDHVEAVPESVVDKLPASVNHPDLVQLLFVLMSGKVFKHLPTRIGNDVRRTADHAATPVHGPEVVS